MNKPKEMDLDGLEKNVKWSMNNLGGGDVWSYCYQAIREIKAWRAWHGALTEDVGMARVLGVTPEEVRLPPVKLTDRERLAILGTLANVRADDERDILQIVGPLRDWLIRNWTSQLTEAGAVALVTKLGLKPTAAAVELQIRTTDTGYLVRFGEFEEAVAKSADVPAVAARVIGRHFACEEKKSADYVDRKKQPG